MEHIYGFCNLVVESLLLIDSEAVPVEASTPSFRHLRVSSLPVNARDRMISYLSVVVFAFLFCRIVGERDRLHETEESSPIG